MMMFLLCLASNQKQKCGETMRYLSASILLLAFLTGAVHADGLSTHKDAHDRKQRALRPNILLAIADDLSHASAYGTKFLNTPNIDAIAREGLLFHRMYTPSSKCAPSRAVLLTGRNPWQLEELANHKADWPNKKYKSVIEALVASGYFAGYTGKGWAPGTHPKNRNLTGRSFNELTKATVPAKGIKTIDYAGNFQQFLNQRPEDQPFVFWYGGKEPHRGYEYKSGVRLGKKFTDLDFTPSFWGNSESVKHDILDYAVEVEYFDQQFGEILKHLESTGALDNTLIIVTSDNGMPFPRYKGHPHEFATRVPCAIKWPGKIANVGRDVEQFASFIDIAPTLLDVAGLEHDQAEMEPMEGRSLVDFFSDKPVDRTRVLTGRERNDMCRPHGWSYPVRSLHKGDFVYMHNFEPERWPAGTPESGFRDTDWGPTKTNILNKQADTANWQLCFGKRPEEEYYNIATDPECINNLAADAQYARPIKQMRSELFAELKRQGDPRIVADGAIFDRYQPRRHQEYDDLLKPKKKQ